MTTKLVKCERCGDVYSRKLYACPQCHSKQARSYYQRITPFCNCEQCKALRKMDKANAKKKYNDVL